MHNDPRAERRHGEPAHVAFPGAVSGFLIVCEHASNWIPPEFEDLGLPADLRRSHIAWDPGALGVAMALAARLEAGVVYGGVSRLIYDCNRPPEASDAIPARSEVHEIPGNAELSAAARADRVARVYEPFRRTLSEEIARRRAALRALVTVHSFTPVYKGRARAVEIGVLHGDDPRLAQVMLDRSPSSNRFETRLNAPYGPEDGVAHTLNLHGVANALPNVMLEIRSDLIETTEAQAAMANLFAPWLVDSLAAIDRGDAS